MVDPTPLINLDAEDKAELLAAAVLEVVPISVGFGLAVDVVADEDATTVGRQYFIFDDLDAANAFQVLVRGGFN